MANLINVERSKYINRNIELFSENKVGQYSKFLNKNPVFVTYYSINDRMSRADIGTGGIQDEIGPSSPIRFNKISELPVYNMPDMIRPDLEFDESGYDINIDLSDITLLPNTIKPIPGDYMLFVIPGTKEFLFRVNRISNNSIQSNDFYQIELDIKDIGIDLEEKRISKQIVERYQTIFENIGTQDKCFILEDDIEKINDLVRSIEIIKDNYYNSFYNKDCNSFVLEGFDLCGNMLYDPYLESFITKSNIYYEPDNEFALALIPNDILPSDFEYIFSRTIWNAFLRRDLKLLHDFTYFYVSSITKNFSPFNLFGYPCQSVKLYLSDKPLFNEEEIYNNIDISDSIEYPFKMITKKDNMNIEFIIPTQFTSEDGFEVAWDDIDPMYNNNLMIDKNIVPNNNGTYYIYFSVVLPKVFSHIYYDGELADNKIRFTEDGHTIISLPFAIYEGEEKDPVIEKAELTDWKPILRDIRVSEIKITYEDNSYSIINISNINKDIETGELIPSIKYPEIDCQCPLNPNYEKELIPNTCIEVSKDGLKLYTDYELIRQITSGELTSEDYLDIIIFNYFKSIKEDINIEKLIKILLKRDYRSFKYTPMILYILIQYYNDYFRNNDIDKKKIFAPTTL